MKYIFYFLIHLQIFIFTKNDKLSNINSGTAQIVVHLNKLFFITNDNNDDELHIYDLTNSLDSEISISSIKKSKVLMSLNEEQFILVGYENDNNYDSTLHFKIYNSSNYQNPTQEKQYEGIIYNPKINIIMVNEKIFLLYFFQIISNNLFVYFYKFDISKTNYENDNIVNLDMEGLEFNTLECDSLDGLKILCVYSLISPDGNTIKYKYFIRDIQKKEFLFEPNEINDQYSNIKAVSINKLVFNNEGEFIMCFIPFISNLNGNTYQLICQTLPASNNYEMYEQFPIDEKLIYIIGTSNYRNKIPIKILIYKYTIYILIELLDINSLPNEHKTILYSCSLDFGLTIKSSSLKVETTNTGLNLLVNSTYNVIMYESISTKTNIHYYLDLTINCEDFEKQFNGENRNSGISLNDNFLKSKYFSSYMAFSLEQSTNLKVNGKRNFGGLNGELNLTGPTSYSSINLTYVKSAQITNNYYILYNKIWQQSGNYYYVIRSHFCYFKIINCQDSCSKCHSNIVGTSENHQCESCYKDYFKYRNDENEEGYYNCYKKDDPIIPKNMFIDNDTFEYCNETCKECFNRTDCKICKDGYYFKVDERLKIILENKCYNTIPEHYYLNYTYNQRHNNETVLFAYKPCHYTCKTCLGDGDDVNNNCILCDEEKNYIKYDYDDKKCTFNKSICTYPYWKLDPNKLNIECIDDCGGFVIKNTTEKLKNNFNQCVDECYSFLNPYLKYGGPEFYSLISFECGGEKSCITVDECKSRGLQNDNWKCYPDGNSCYFIPRTTIPVIPPTTQTPPPPPTEMPTPTIQIIEIENKVQIIKNFEIKNSYSELKSDLKENLFRLYEEGLKNELSFGKYINGIDFITFSKYKDFNATIYPLETEQYVKDNLLNVKNFIYINFTKCFENYEKQNENSKILIALIEHKNINLPINTVNYFFILFDENNKKHEFFEYNNSYNNLIEISYPLYNYEHENISEKYSSELIKTIKELNNINENFNFFDQSNSFYNDICCPYDFDKDIDMTIKDRILEYYIEIPFCENNCSFKYIFDKQLNPKSFCECQLKQEIDLEESNYSFNTTTKEKDSVSNINALKCYKEVFTSGELPSNPSFWIFFIMIFIHIALFISIFFCAKSAIENMLKAKKASVINEENNINNNNNEDNNIIQINNNENNNINDKKEKLEKSKEEELSLSKSKSNSINESSNIKERINSIEENESKVFKLSKKNNSGSNPPKKNLNKNRETTGNKQDSKKENETSLFESELNYNYNLDKDSGFEDIFDDLGGPSPKVNNYIQDEKNYKIDNYIYLEKKNLFQKIMQAIPPLDKKEFNKYKYINTVNEYNDTKQNKNINITGADLIKKEHYSMDDIKINPKNLNLINYSDIKNKGQKLSKFSKLFGEESILSGNEKFLQAANNIDNKKDKNNNKKEDNYEKEIKENNNKNDSSGNSNISEKKESEKDSNINNLFKKKKKASINSSYLNSESGKLKNSLNASLNSNDKLISKRNIKNQKEDPNQKLKNQQKSQEEKEEIIYKKKSIISSSESDADESIVIAEKNKNCCYIYCDYFCQRELFLCTFYHKQDNVSIFIRLPTFFVGIGFIFTLTCLFLTENEIHKRYQYYNEHGKIDEFKYAFTNNLGKCFIISLISIVFKMLCIKLVYFVTFNISPGIKEEIYPYENKSLNQSELKKYNSKKKKYLKRYKTRTIIFMIIILILLLAFAYGSTCYIGIFKHSFINILINFVISVIFSFVICALLCFVVSIFYVGGCHRIFKVLKIIY